MSTIDPRLLERARAELPAPGDPRRLIEDLLAAGLCGPASLEVVQRCTTAWVQLHDLGLERHWASGYGWFLARNLMLFALCMLPLAVVFNPPPGALEAFLGGAGLYYLVVLVLMPLRLRHGRRRRDAILEAYGEDLSSWLEQRAR